MSQIRLVNVKVARNCTHGGVMYGRGDYAVPANIARAMHANGDLSAAPNYSETVSLEDYDAKRADTKAPLPMDLRSGFGAAGAGAIGAPVAGTGGAQEARTDNEPAARTPTPYDAGAEGNFLLTGDEPGAGEARAPEAGRSDMSGIVEGDGSGGGSGSGATRDGIVIGGRSGGDATGSGAGGAAEPPTGFAQPTPGGLQPLDHNAPGGTAGSGSGGAQTGAQGAGSASGDSGAGTGAESGSGATGGASAGVSGSGADADDPGAETSTLTAPPVADANAPLRGEIPTDFPKRTELAAAGITSLEQLSTMNREQLIGVRGIGEKSADAIGLRLYEMVERSKDS